MFIVALRREVVAQRGNFYSQTVSSGERIGMLQGEENDQPAGLSRISDVASLPFDVRQQDREFLDGLVKSEPKDVPAENSPLARGRSDEENEILRSSQAPVPRAELVVNTQVVRRAELVTPNGAAKARR
jgi:hypothetical protein